MADPHGNSLSKYHLLFGRKPSNSKNITVLISIKSIWGDDHIEKLETTSGSVYGVISHFRGLTQQKL